MTSKPIPKEEVGLGIVANTFIRLFSYVVCKKLEASIPVSCNWADCIVDDSPLTIKELSMKDFKSAPAKLDDLRAEVQDHLEDFNVGTIDNPPILYVCSSLPHEMKGQLKYLLHN